RPLIQRPRGIARSATSRARVGPRGRRGFHRSWLVSRRVRSLDPAAMSRLFLAFLCFFRVLFGRKLPPAAAAFLPEGATAGALPEPATTKIERAEGKPVVSSNAGGRDAAKDARADVEKPKASAAQHHRDGALALLALLQREGRFVDFLREPLD